MNPVYEASVNWRRGVASTRARRWEHADGDCSVKGIPVEKMFQIKLDKIRPVMHPARKGTNVSVFVLPGRTDCTLADFKHSHVPDNPTSPVVCSDRNNLDR